MQAGNSFFARDAPEIAIHSLFDKYDAIGRGKLGRTELQTLLEDDLGLTAEQSCIYTLLLDHNGDHYVSFEEFLNWLRSGERFQNIDDKSRFWKLCLAVEIFKSFDTDDSDTLDQSQFKNLIVSVGYEHVDAEKLFDELDRYRNGKLSFWEFMQWLNWVPIEM